MHHDVIGIFASYIYNGHRFRLESRLMHRHDTPMLSYPWNIASHRTPSLVIKLEVLHLEYLSTPNRVWSMELLFERPCPCNRLCLIPRITCTTRSATRIQWAHWVSLVRQTIISIDFQVRAAGIASRVGTSISDPPLYSFLPTPPTAWIHVPSKQPSSTKLDHFRETIWW